jgi:Immunoglobulin domain
MKSFHHLHESKAGFSQNPTCRNRLTSLLVTLLASLAFLALSATSARAQTLTNWLTNPGFEASASTPTGWTIISPWTWSGPSYAVQTTNSLVNGSPTIHATVHGGGNAIKIWGYQGANYTTYPGVMQTFAAAPGSTWTADGWISTQVPDNMRGSSYGNETAFYEVLFLDANTNYNTPLLTCYSAPLTTNGPTGTWLHFTVTNSATGTTLVAPDGTAFVRFEAVFAQPGGYPAGSAYYDDAQLIRTSKPDPEITAQPAPLTMVYGQTATFSVAADGLSTLTYKWQKDGADITDPDAHGVTTSTLTLSNVTTTMMGNYTVTVTDTAGPLTSNPAYLTVNDPGVISIAPALGQTVVAGTNITITVAAAGSSALTYAWYKDGNPLSNNGHYAGVTTPTLSISGVTTDDNSTNYTVLIDGGASTAANGLKVVAAAQVATNLISNPGFEDSIFSLPWENTWNPFNGALIDTTNDYYYLTATPVSVYDGTYVARVYNNGNVDDGIYQNVPVVAGTAYHAGAHCYVSSIEPMTAAAYAVVQLFFKDAGGNNLAAYTTGHIDTSVPFPMDAWTTLEVTNGTSSDLVAPVGTVSATLQVYENASSGGGSVYLDDMYLTPAAVTPPLPPAFSITPSVSAGQFNLSFQTANGAIYEVLYSGNAASALSTWQTNTTVIGDGSVRTVPDTLGAGARFYRVRAHNP